MSHFLTYTLIECQALLTEKTGKEWSRDELFEQLYSNSLQVFATTPASARIVIRSLGEEHYAGFPAAGRRFALLLTPHIRDVWLHGSATTAHPALEPGDAGYQTFLEVLAVRATHNRSGHTEETWPFGDWDNGEFMGECDVQVFAEYIEVTEATCRVPSSTVDELVRLTLAKHNAETASG
ncbi:hypothetical protein LXA47_25480, partial [Massilia sp. P8910]|uniref:hypothetical protein n=1 Tax=Massilia antarctica TaxID=2765360 RepID=UPI001E3C0809